MLWGNQYHYANYNREEMIRPTKKMKRGSLVLMRAKMVTKLGKKASLQISFKPKTETVQYFEF